MKDIGIKRICVSVSELEKSLAFFTGEMELTEVCRGRLDEQTVAAVYGLGSSAAEYAMLKNEEQPTLLQLICFTNTPKRPIREGRPSWDFGYYDVAFRAKDNSWAYEHFRDLGFDYYCPPTRYVADWINLDVLEGVLKGPDAMPMALIERLKEPIPRFEGMFSIFTDVAQTVASGEEAARFYEGVLGLSKVFDEELPDGLVDDIVGVPHGTHTLIWNCFETPVLPCDDCGYCRHRAGCSKRDLDGFYAELEEADRLLFATPVYHRSFPAPMKAVLDRLQRYWSARFVLGLRPPIAKPKRGILLTVSGSPSDEGGRLIEQQLAPHLTVLNTTLAGTVHYVDADAGAPLDDAAKALCALLADG